MAKIAKASARGKSQNHQAFCNRHAQGSHRQTLPLVRAIITAHFFVTRPHYLRAMQKLAEIDLRIKQVILAAAASTAAWLKFFPAIRARSRRDCRAPAECADGASHATVVGSAGI